MDEPTTKGEEQCNTKTTIVRVLQVPLGCSIHKESECSQASSVAKVRDPVDQVASPYDRTLQDRPVVGV